MTPGATIALVARADHDADDLTGLEMPTPTPTPVDGGEEEVWEDVTDGCADAVGGRPSRRAGTAATAAGAVETPRAKIAAAAETRARERGFAGTGLHGND